MDEREEGHNKGFLLFFKQTHKNPKWQSGWALDNLLEMEIKNAVLWLALGELYSQQS